MFILDGTRYYKVNTRTNGTQYYTVNGKRQNVGEGADLVEKKPKVKRVKVQTDNVTDDITDKMSKVTIVKREKMAEDEFYSAKNKGPVKGHNIRAEQNGKRWSLLAEDADGNKLRKFASAATAEKFA
jgi:hypothetical protein